MMTKNNSIIEKLIMVHGIPKNVIDNLLRQSNNKLIDFSLLLIKDKYISRQTMGQLISELYDTSYVELSKISINKKLMRIVPQNMAEELEFVAIYEFGETITIAISDLENKEKQKQICYIFNKPCSLVFSFPDEIRKQLLLYYQSLDVLDATTYGNSLKKFSDTTSITGDKITTLLNEKEIINILNAIVNYAIRERASDIHLEPYRTYVTIRFRIDGRLQNVMNLPLELHDALINRLKILANLDISEKRVPLDGKFTFRLADEAIDIRVAILPTIAGEKAALRVLAIDNQIDKLNLFDLGITTTILNELKVALKKSNGMLFVTGPTGAGKTTTLYAMIEYIKKPEVNIITIEDPVEYELPGITQVEVHADVGRDFKTVLRGVLRQDPDVILVGEIRDLETAQIAATAALTGHTVLTTLHTNNAIQALTRMTDMGVQNFVVAPSIIGVINQRLVRMICPDCKYAYTPTSAELSLFQLDPNTPVPSFYRGKGCENCHYIGYKGRIPILEYIRISPRLRANILENASHDIIAQTAKEEGYKDLRYDGMLKVLQGLTTLEEILRVSSNADVD